MNAIEDLVQFVDIRAILRCEIESEKKVLTAPWDVVAERLLPDSLGIIESLKKVLGVAPRRDMLDVACVSHPFDDARIEMLMVDDFPNRPALDKRADMRNGNTSDDKMIIDDYR